MYKSHAAPAPGTQAVPTATASAACEREVPARVKLGLYAATSRASSEKKHWSAMTSFAVFFYCPASLRAFKVPKDAPRAIATKLTTISGIVRGMWLMTVPCSEGTRIVKNGSSSPFAGANDGCANALSVAPQ